MARREESGLPNAKKFMGQVLRGSTYSFATAICDLIDNSIEALAHNVYIDVSLEKLQVIIADDGHGMTDAVHSEAMKVAAETRDYEDDDLGKYGTGMKAASLSQANCVTVATRPKLASEITVRRLDMDHIAATNDWNRLTLVLTVDDLPQQVIERLSNHSGTAVIWDQLDRIFINNTLTQSEAREELRKQLASTEDFIAMTFHRFLEGSVQTKPLRRIFINGQEVRPWNPFAINEPNRTLADEGPQIEVNGAHIKLVGYVLPGEKEFSSKEAFKMAGGPNRWVQSQGFWVYRNDRLIRGGGWLRMRSPDPHMSLARIAIDFPSALDSVFQVNVAKSSVELPLAIKQQLDPFVTRVIARAKKRYGQQSKLGQVSTGGLPGRGVLPQSGVQRKMTAKAFADFLVKVTSHAGLDSELDHIMKVVREQNSSVADEIGW